MTNDEKFRALDGYVSSSLGTGPFADEHYTATIPLSENRGVHFRVTLSWEARRLSQRYDMLREVWNAAIRGALAEYAKIVGPNDEE